MPRMFGSRIMLREFSQSDLEAMRKWIIDPDTTQFLSDTFTVPQTFEQTAAYLDSIISGKQPDVHLVIANLMSGDYLGQCDLMNLTSYSRKAALAIVLAPDCRGMGYGSEALELLLELAFYHLNLNRVSLRVRSDNARAIRCYEKCGFICEGINREDLYNAGRYYDTIAMGILRADWERTRPGQNT